MSLDRFQQYLQRLNPTAPNAKWSEIWLRRFFEFWKTPHNENLSIDAPRLIAFLQHVKARGTPAWQCHQAGISAAVSAGNSNCRFGVCGRNANLN